MLHRARALALATVTLTLLLLLPAPPAAATAPRSLDQPGRYAVGYTRFEARDESRQRTLPVHVWYPVDPSAAQGAPPAVYTFIAFGLESPVAVADAPVARRGLFPLVIFSHGNGGIGIQSYFLTERLASYGFVVVAPDHVGDTLLDALVGGIGSEEIIQSALDRPRDVSFLIDTMFERTYTAGDRFYLAVNPLRVGVVGHSFGGFTALAVAAGFRAEAAEAFGIEVPEDFVPIPPDPRVRAIVPISPASTPLGDGELSGVRIPTLLVGGTLDNTTPLVPEITRPYAKIPARVLYRADLQGAAHFSFTNACDLIALALDQGIPQELIEDLVDEANEEGCGPGLMPIEEAHRLTNKVTVAFLRRYLAGDLHYEPFLQPARMERNEPNLDFLRRAPLPRWLELWFASTSRRAH